MAKNIYYFGGSGDNSWTGLAAHCKVFGAFHNSTFDSDSEDVSAHHNGKGVLQWVCTGDGYLDTFFRLRSSHW